MNRITKISALAASIVAGGMLLAPAALADNNCTISGNGARSRNKCTINVTSGRRHKGGGVTQTNSAVISNGVTVNANTGGNKANENTGGDVSVTSGDATVNVTITNEVNSNNAGGGI